MTDAPSATRFLDGFCVLVVEDEAIISFLLEDMLGDLGAADVRHAGNVRTALALLETFTPGLAVLDVNLGGERVYPVAEALEAKGVPFVFTTGYGKSGIEPRWAPRPVVQKPFNIEAMFEALRALLSAR